MLGALRNDFKIASDQRVAPLALFGQARGGLGEVVPEKRAPGTAAGSRLADASARTSRPLTQRRRGLGASVRAESPALPSRGSRPESVKSAR